MQPLESLKPSRTSVCIIFSLPIWVPGRLNSAESVKRTQLRSGNRQMAFLTCVLAVSHSQTPVFLNFSPRVRTEVREGRKIFYDEPKILIF